jgi:site-specific DNA-adenine methylase
MQKVWQGKCREDSMLTREATYEDYGFSEDEDKRLGEFCKNLEMRDKILLLQCAAEVYPNIVDELYCCIVIGMSYDKMNKKKFVALDRKDFYAYRKKTLAVFREALKACNRYPF